MSDETKDSSVSIALTPRLAEFNCYALAILMGQVGRGKVPMTAAYQELLKELIATIEPQVSKAVWS